MSSPGETCTGCGRRVPFPKTEKSPQTKKKAYWVAVDDAEDHDAILRAAAKHLGVAEQPFYEFKTVTVALTLLLQDESLRGFGK